MKKLMILLFGYCSIIASDLYDSCMRYFEGRGKFVEAYKAIQPKECMSYLELIHPVTLHHLIEETKRQISKADGIINQSPPQADIEYWKLHKINARIILDFLDEIGYSSFCPAGLMESLRAINNTIYKTHGLEHFSKSILNPDYIAKNLKPLRELCKAQNARKLNYEFARAMQCQHFREMIAQYSMQSPDPNFRSFLEIVAGPGLFDNLLEETYDVLQ